MLESVGKLTIHRMASISHFTTHIILIAWANLVIFATSYWATAPAILKIFRNLSAKVKVLDLQDYRPSPLDPKYFDGVQ